MLGEKNGKLKPGPLSTLALNQITKISNEKSDEISQKNIQIEEYKEKTLKKTIDSTEEGPAVNRFSVEEKKLAQKVVAEALNAVLEEEAQFISRNDRERIINEVADEISGYGPINPFLNDPEVHEIMVNGPGHVYIEKNGKIFKTSVVFRDNDHVRHTIDKIITPLGRRLDDTSPTVDARLPDGSRVNAVIPPLAIDGPTLTIRKFSKEPYTVEDLISFGTLSTDMAIFIKACVESRINILISGGTSSGKTTTLNVLSSFIPPSERIITIEDAAELSLWQEHIVRLESRPPNIEGRGEVTIRDLVINALRMRPDRIIVGEVRGGEALDMLQAMNTGHDGSITTGHANSPRDMLLRLETMVLMAGLDLPIRAIREQISTAINLVVHQERLSDGSRRIVKITEITGMESDTIAMQDIFVYKKRGIDDRGRVSGRLAPTGVVPKFIEKIEYAGISVPHKIFRSS